ncbi:hypothetical protein V7S43_006834 [Phytophthora oleae]|uniref:Kazal-like domain-containing protein n=1 Tax=Phytophthora oleae TaxID=2107226 RepID=A0ABD3FQ28_9STRA
MLLLAQRREERLAWLDHFSFLLKELTRFSQDKMKFTASLVIAAIAASTVRAGNPAMQTTLTSESGSESASASVDSSELEDTGTSCNFACLAVMRPVTDENGVTYSNECMMRAAKCKGKRKDVNVLEEYKRLYGKSFGASRDADDAGDESASDESASDEDGSASESSGAVKILQGAPESNDSSEEESASDDGSDKDTPKSYCPNILCPAVFSPVWDENGVQYPNECSMKASKCKGPKENVLDEYKRIYGKEFGAPRDESGSDDASESDDGSSSMATKMVKGTKGSSKAEKSKKATKTSSDSDSDIGSLYDDGSEGVIDDGSSTPSTKCAGACPDVELPVCGSDGVWYSNPCELKIAACENPEADIVEDDAACSSKVTKGEKKAGKITTDVIW